MRFPRQCDQCVGGGAPGVPKVAFFGSIFALVVCWVLLFLIGGSVPAIRPHALKSFVSLICLLLFVVGIILCLFNALIASSFVRVNILRKNRDCYVFLDEDGAAHGHRSIELTSDVASNSLIVGFNVGGWFSKNVVFGAASEDWTLVGDYPGPYYFEDCNGERINYDSPHHSLPLVERFESVGHMRMVLNAQEALTGYFAAHVLTVLERIKLDKERLGRSKHAKALREYFEQMFVDLQGIVPQYDILLELWNEGAVEQTWQVGSTESYQREKLIAHRDLVGRIGCMLPRVWDMRWDEDEEPEEPQEEPQRSRIGIRGVVDAAQKAAEQAV